MNMTFPLSYIFFFYFCHGEGRNVVSFPYSDMCTYTTHAHPFERECVCTVYSSTSCQNQGDRHIQKVRHQVSPGEGDDTGTNRSRTE